ncbi:MAG: HIT family hydrolase [Candidatus Taylorbacteria bacterium RIFCSPHIGHO2_02_49_25]|uniref:HIT family hydrolase n=1 Tax=Candidatus Taylorbacteria bacterium RIFCSPHIGHO2_02_49_25 TaxID=1802305 RepID=A0A1G2MIE5_9BACT|nr:MAG: Histidine triad (HIT) protein [Parcubacteria group bacterium GW2011_GWF2_50_9]OHA19779.1 MAG: HIT family hydrolase [Candidatus Taylorbacteria bacterium RIFCSPHIGHO2_01_FULL_49_60]OHA23494.1 MAG: HIT family hydrolase [Candidatus Taylorbacteria bacterium RIFCSPHIGHO2_02_49_25]OHA35209.1 MAG: HIT family hydrolase [Candidatus Taylorbacteria bacterium RIFCSPLOWO2_01_FULL_50_130]OHA36847.1 MAG: HIT family hydrolase [Candidatus Taylorbacteria bacterium RIFCSPLOWO2_02_50_13]OHA41822.1 MAG: HIT
MPPCIFCKIIVGELPSTKVYEDDEVLAFLDIKPINPGHTLVIPKKHFENIHDMPDALVAKVAVAAKKIADAMLNIGVKGVNVGMNNGAHAGQIIFHAHVHVMPRYGKDSFSLWVGKEYDGNEREEAAAKIRQALNP